MPGDGGVLLVSGLTGLADAVGSAAATAGVRVRQTGDPVRAREAWAEARVVLIGEDCARAMVGLAPPRREHVYLVSEGEAEPDASLLAWSMPLGAPVVRLPEGAGWLLDVLVDDRPAGSVPILAVLGASGGVGASTLAAGLAVRAARRTGDRVALVDADAEGGGIDLVLGLEASTGWRWPNLAEARGQVGDIAGLLPGLGGVVVVSMARGEGPPPEAAVAPVVTSLARGSRVVIVDVGRGWGPVAQAGLAMATRTLVVAAPHVLSVAAARQVLSRLHPPRAGVVVRTGGLAVEAGLVAHAIGAPLVGAVPDDAALVTAVESGEPPGRRPRRPWTQACDRILDQVGP